MEAKLQEVAQRVDRVWDWLDHGCADCFIPKVTVSLAAERRVYRNRAGSAEALLGGQQPVAVAGVGAAQAGVEAHNGRWDHDDWLALLEELRRSPHWPLQPDAVGAALDDAKRGWPRGD